MKAISLWEPWAWLVAAGAKRYETRSWKTHYRGPLAIHAAKHWNRETQLRVGSHPFARWWDIRHEMGKTHKGGCIIAVVELADCRWAKAVKAELQMCINGGGYQKRRRQLVEELAFGDFSGSRFAWSLTSVQMLRVPVYTKGHQGLWTLNSETLSKVTEAMP